MFRSRCVNTTKQPLLQLLLYIIDKYDEYTFAVHHEHKAGGVHNLPRLGQTYLIDINVFITAIEQYEGEAQGDISLLGAEREI